MSLVGSQFLQLVVGLEIALKAGNKICRVICRKTSASFEIVSKSFLKANLPPMRSIRMFVKRHGIFRVLWIVFSSTTNLVLVN